MAHAQVFLLAVLLAGGAASAGEPRYFAVVGDAGGGDGRAQRRVARRMALAHQAHPFDTVLVLGDNVHEKSFGRAIRSPYRALFRRGVRFLPVLGNHDVESGRQAGDRQLAFWGARPRLRTRLGDAELFGFDTTLFMPGSEAVYGGDLAKLRRRELRWLDRALARSDAKYKIVWAHHPLYGSVRSGDEAKTTPLRRAIEPILTKHGVTLYLAGHYHHLARTAPVSGVTHIVSGGGGSDLVPPAPGGAPWMRAVPAHHFLLFEVGDHGLAFSAIGADGRVVDQGRIAP